LAEAAELLQIKLLDHIIIGAPSDSSAGYFSFKELMLERKPRVRPFNAVSVRPPAEQAGAAP
jgi:hypothetical protein